MAARAGVAGCGSTGSGPPRNRCASGWLGSCSAQNRAPEPRAPRPVLSSGERRPGALVLDRTVMRAGSVSAHHWTRRSAMLYSSPLLQGILHPGRCSRGVPRPAEGCGSRSIGVSPWRRAAGARQAPDSRASARNGCKRRHRAAGGHGCGRYGVDRRLELRVLAGLRRDRLANPRQPQPQRRLHLLAHRNGDRRGRNHRPLGSGGLPPQPLLRDPRLLRQRLVPSHPHHLHRGSAARARLHRRRRSGVRLPADRERLPVRFLRPCRLRREPKRRRRQLPPPRSARRADDHRRLA